MPKHVLVLIRCPCLAGVRLHLFGTGTVYPETTRLRDGVAVAAEENNNNNNNNNNSLPEKKPSCRPIFTLRMFLCLGIDIMWPSAI